MAENTKAAAPAATDNSKDYVPPPAPEMVPVVMLIGEAGLNLRYGEIIGVPPAIAEAMKAKKHARDLTAEEKKTGKAIVPPLE